MQPYRVHRSIDAGPLSLTDLSRLVGRLPPAKAAEFAWAPQSIKKALDELLTAELTPELVRSTCTEVMSALHALWPAIVELYAEAELLRAELEGFWRANAATLREFLRDPGAADSAEWALRAGQAMVDFVLTLPPELVRELRRASVDELLEAVEDDEAGGLLRAQVLLMAVFEAATEGRGLRRAEELADYAFLEAAEGVAALNNEGVGLDPYRGETPAERGARVLRYAERVRTTLSDDDVATLASARLDEL